jgi:CPA1 family monovalent cation:H+ antiporter
MNSATAANTIGSLFGAITDSHFAGLVAAFVVLLAVAGVIAIVTRRLRVPYTVGLVLVGLVVGLSHRFHGIELSSGLVFYVFLPALLFEASFNLQVRHLLNNWRGITVLAVPGVVAAFLLTATGVRLLGETWTVALVFGALIAATDPVSVVALFRRLRVDSRLTTIVEAESLFNDGTAAVLFAIVIGVVLREGDEARVSYALEFARMFGGAMILGLALGYLAALLHRRIDDHLIEITLSTVVAYGVFLLGERLGVSGVVACVTAGIVVGHFGRHDAFSAETRAAMETFWEYAAFAVNSLIFLLIGLRANLGTLSPLIVSIGLAFLVVLVARAVVVYSYGVGARLARRPLPWAWQHVLVWGGLRGTVALALVLATPTGVPGRSRLEVLVFGVVLLSLLIQGLTMRPLVMRLNLVQRGGDGPSP